MKGQRGWFYESNRHSLAAKGIKTGRKTPIALRKDTDGDGVEDIDDCDPYDPEQQAFLDNLKDHIQHYYDISKDKAEHLIAEIRENAPKTWEWLKSKEHQLEERFHIGIQKFREEHPLHSTTSAEVISHIENQTNDVPQEEDMEELEEEGEPPRMEDQKPKKKSIWERGKEYLEQRRQEREELQRQLDLLSNEELKKYAIAYKPNLSFLALTPEKNPYEEELLRRIAKEEQINREINAIRKGKKLTNTSGDYSFMDFLIGKDIWGKEKKGD